MHNFYAGCISVLKMSLKKLIRKSDVRSFSKFLSCNVLVTFKQHFQCILNQLKILHFLVLLSIFYLHIPHFGNYEVKWARICSKFQKNIYSKCVLDLKRPPFLPLNFQFPEKVKKTMHPNKQKKYNSKITSALQLSRKNWDICRIPLLQNHLSPLRNFL